MVALVTLRLVSTGLHLRSSDASDIWDMREAVVVYESIRATLWTHRSHREGLGSSSSNKNACRPPSVVAINFDCFLF
uniref:Putative secreted protein n=1 Tax=Anopheles triannulatus TaxID=58253 RepID=A0A2M4B3B3_9DIPT